MMHPAAIATALRKAATAQREILEAIKHTRTAIVALGGELAALIAALPPEDVGAIALGVVVIMRGTPTVDDIPGLVTEYLHALDDESYETRPGATSLYLEALGKGQSRVYLEVRSSPGQIVLSTSSVRELDDWLESVRGIVIDADSRVRLCRRRASGRGRPESSRRPRRSRAARKLPRIAAARTQTPFALQSCRRLVARSVERASE
jgi:hypothetical protein